MSNEAGTSNEAVASTKARRRTKSGIGKLSFFCPLLFISLWFPWYKGEVDGGVFSTTVSGWTILNGLDVLLVTVAFLPLLIIAAGAATRVFLNDQSAETQNAFALLAITAAAAVYSVVCIVAAVWMTSRWMKEPAEDLYIHVGRAWGIWVAYGSTLMVTIGAVQVVLWGWNSVKRADPQAATSTDPADRVKAATVPPLSSQPAVTSSRPMLDSLTDTLLMLLAMFIFGVAYVAFFAFFYFLLILLDIVDWDGVPTWQYVLAIAGAFAVGAYQGFRSYQRASARRAGA